MINVEYNYKIISVDEDNKVMEIKYTPQNPSTLNEYNVSARLPFVGEPLLAVIQRYAPLGLWQSELYEFDTVVEGTEGSISCEI